jgi:palmitoyltransferase
VEETKDAFHRRQHEDMKRWSGESSQVQRRRPFYKRLEVDLAADDEAEDTEMSEQDGEEGWRNSEGERLADFGVDELVEFYDDDVPLALLRARKQAHGE